MKRNLFSSFLDYTAMIILSFFILSCWIHPTGYSMFVRFASPGVFLALSCIFFANINLWEQLRKKDIELILVIAAVFLSLINMIIVKSNYGAIFSIADMLLILYLADKSKFTNRQLFIPTISCSIPFLIWILFKRPTLSSCDFNTNGAAFIIFACGILAICGISYFLEKKAAPPKLYHLIAGIFIVSVLIQSLRLHARGSMLGILCFAVVYFILPKKPWTAYAILFGSIAFPFVYLLLWKSGVTLSISIADKNFYSGRELIWNEFLNAFLKYPITGIGSNFERMVPNSPLYEVHHAILNILFVHGTPVFLITLYLWIKRLKGLFHYTSFTANQMMCLAGIYGMMVIGTFENFYISAPFNMIYYMLMVLIYQKNFSKSHKSEAGHEAPI